METVVAEAKETKPLDRLPLSQSPIDPIQLPVPCRTYEVAEVFLEDILRFPGFNEALVRAAEAKVEENLRLASQPVCLFKLHLFALKRVMGEETMSEGGYRPSNDQ